MNVLPKQFQSIEYTSGNSVSVRQPPVKNTGLQFGFKACSHEPRTVNYPGGSVTSRSHDDLLSRVNFIALGQVQRHLITTNLSEFLQFLYNCYREWILNAFTYFWCFLELFIRKFVPNINNEHMQDYSCPGTTFAFCSHGEKLPR